MTCLEGYYQRPGCGAHGNQQINKKNVHTELFVVTRDEGLIMSTCVGKRVEEDAD